MSEFWKSQPRHFCEFCKCWIADNKPSRDFHEKGKRHKENVERRIKEVREKSEEHWKVQQENKDFLQQMEAAALKAAAKDIASDPSLASQYGIKAPVHRPPSVNIDTVSSWAVPGKKVEEKVSQPEREEDIGPWIESTSPEGYTYYYNTVTEESQWELPSSLKTSEESAKTVEKKTVAKATGTTSESENASCPWVEGSSPEGHVYYYNTETGESQWEKPANFTSSTKEVKSEESRSEDKDEKEQEEKASTSSSQEEAESCQWIERTSPEGYTYYSNTVTGKSQWEKPSDFTSGKSAVESSKKVKRKDEEKEEEKEEAPAEVTLHEKVEKSEGAEEEVKEEKKEKRPLKRKSAYGAWTTVQQTSQKIDLQLPCGAADLKPDPTPQFTQEPVRVKFKEKTVTSLSSGVFSSTEPVGFKKKKVRANRSIRRRDDED